MLLLLMCIQYCRGLSVLEAELPLTSVCNSHALGTSPPHKLVQRHTTLQHTHTHTCILLQVPELILDNCKIESLEGVLDEFVNLEILSVNNCHLKSLKGFPSIATLKRVSGYMNPLLLSTLSGNGKSLLCFSCSA